MTNIYDLQIEIYNQADYNRDRNKWILEPLLLKHLQAEVTEFIDDKVTYENEERTDLVQMMTIGAIEEIITALQKSNDLYTAKEIEIAFMEYLNV